jgi:hypothetical protein
MPTKSSSTSKPTIKSPIEIATATATDSALIHFEPSVSLTTISDTTTSTRFPRPRDRESEGGVGQKFVEADDVDIDVVNRGDRGKQGDGADVDAANKLAKLPFDVAIENSEHDNRADRSTSAHLMSQKTSRTTAKTIYDEANAKKGTIRLGPFLETIAAPASSSNCPEIVSFGCLCAVLF